MFSVRLKREIADAVQKILRDTSHPELPVGEINFNLDVYGAQAWSWASIRNNGAITTPDVNPHNEKQDTRQSTGQGNGASIATSYAIGPKILSALGVPVERCRRAVIVLEGGKPVTVEAEYYAEFDERTGDERLSEVATITKLFRLVNTASGTGM